MGLSANLEASPIFQPIDPQAVAARLRALAGTRQYLHFEFTRGGFIRNLTAEVEEAVIRGEGPFRIALRCREHGWVIMEGLTLMDDSGPLISFALLDEEQRLVQTLQLAKEAMQP